MLIYDKVILDMSNFFFRVAAFYLKNLNEEECLKHPYQVHTLRHYTGALTDIRPPKSEFYF